MATVVSSTVSASVGMFRAVHSLHKSCTEPVQKVYRACHMHALQFCLLQVRVASVSACKGNVTHISGQFLLLFVLKIVLTTRFEATFTTRTAFMLLLILLVCHFSGSALQGPALRISKVASAVFLRPCVTFCMHKRMSIFKH